VLSIGASTIFRSFQSHILSEKILEEQRYISLALFGLTRDINQRGGDISIRPYGNNSPILSFPSSFGDYNVEFFLIEDTNEAGVFTLNRLASTNHPIPTYPVRLRNLSLEIHGENWLVITFEGVGNNTREGHIVTTTLSLNRIAN